MNDNTIEHLFTTYADDVHKFLVYFAKTGDVDDLVQNTFLKALRALTADRIIENPRTWLISIARNVAIDHLRKDMHTTSSNAEIASLLVSVEPSPEEQAEFNDFRTKLMVTLNQMKMNYRQVIICRAVMDMSVHETARVLGWSHSRVNVTFHRGLKLVRQMLGPDIDGGVENEHPANG